MKIAVIADIHGNALALEAVIADLRHEAPDQVVNLGDCVSGPLWPEETAVILRETGWVTVRGNHDRVVAAGNIPPENRTDSFTYAHMSPESLAWLEGLHPVIRFTDEILLCHGTPNDDNTYLTERIEGDGLRMANESDITARLSGEAAPVICCGHTHIPRLIQLAGSGQTILNPGSVGLAAYCDVEPVRHKSEAGSPHARYATMTKTAAGWQFGAKIVPYDWEKAALEAERNGRPDWARPLRSGFYGPLS